MKELLVKVNQLSVLAFKHYEELEELKVKHASETSEILDSLKKEEAHIFPKVKEYLINHRFIEKCVEFEKNYGALSDSIRKKFVYESKDISDLTMKLDCDGIVCRRGTEIVLVISYDSLDLCHKPNLKLVEK